MRQYLLGHADGGDAERLIDDCLAGIGEIPAAANFGFIYATDALAAQLEVILEKLRARTGIRRWSGCAGIGICATGREYYEQPALAIMLGSFPEPDLCAVPPLRDGVDEFVAGARDWLQRDDFHFGILHGDPANPATPELIAELAARIPGAFFVGGLTSSSGVQAQVADGVCDGGVSGVLFDSEVAVASAHTQGCTPVAERHVITACERNIVIELDGRPALEVLKQDVGEVVARDLRRIAGFIFAAIPIPGSDTGDYMVRNLLGIDPEQGLIAIGDLARQGGELMFCRRDGNSARADMQRMLADIGARIGGTPKGALYYSCLGRGRYQFGENSEELRMIRDALGEIPLVGFFANGEIFHNRLYGYTGVLTVFC